ncbi:hypothetical protein B0H10DRAFT_1969906, partial [Mycena sp. CBHHK59/15]
AYGPILGHARVNDEIYGVYNGDPSFIMNMPSPAEAPSPNPASVHGNFRTPSFLSTRTPYILFIPSQNPWYGPLLGRLDYRHSSIPIRELAPGIWGLAPEVRDDWYTLELNLRAVLFAMMGRSERLWRPAILVPFGYPYRYGYLKTYRTAGAARHVAIRSIDGFLPLIAELSLYFYLLILTEGTVGYESWRSEVCDAARVHPQWFADLEHSAAGDLKIRRIGGIIDLTLPRGTDAALVPASDWDFLVGSIITTKLAIPLYIRWGAIDHYLQVRPLGTLQTLEFIPNWQEVQHLQKLPGSVAFSPWSRTRHCVEGEGKTVLATGSGQRPGETMEAFFLRRKKKCNAILLRETPEAKARRKQKEKHTEKGQVPGNQGHEFLGKRLMATSSVSQLVAKL